MNEPEPKQVIVMRTDLNMRKGKMIAQGAHASMSVFFQMMKRRNEEEIVIREMAMGEGGWTDRWMTGRFTKIVVGTGSEVELLQLHRAAQESKLPCSLITDAGLTEFNGVPTNTCIAIGPWDPAEIDKITGHLKLL
jgi:PTH2 family peptidyl-tRNA hydrolase